MSTKTTLKRIALVAVLSLSLGSFGSVSANAADLAMPTADLVSFNLKKAAPVTPTLLNPVYINWGADTTAGNPGAGKEAVLTVSGALTSYPAGGFVQTLASATANGETSATTPTGAASETATGATYTSKGATNTSFAGNDVTATSTVGFGSFAFTPSVAGDYTLTVWHDADLDGIIDTLETRQTITITVSAQSSYSQTLSTVFTQDGAGTSAAGATSSLYPIHGPKAIANAQLGSATINLKDALGSDITTADAITISAYVTGVGFVTASETDTTPIATGCTGITTRTVSWVANAVDTLYICADGTAGSGSVVISTTSAAGVTTALKTINYSTFGAVAKLAIEAQYVNVLRAGGGTQGVTTDVQPVTYVNHPALVIAATDANGNLVEGLTVGTVSSDLTKISAVTAVEGTGWFGPGYYLSAITTAASSVSGDTATATYRVLDPATGFTTYLTAVANFTFGGSPATVTLSTDAKDYAPGAKGTLTVTAKDSSGNPVADRDYSDFFTAAGVSSTVANVAAGLPGAAVNVMAKGVKTYTFYAPGTRGEFTLAGTLGTSAATASRGTVVSVKATVTDAGFDAVADAAAEAIDAANAATDAANLAAEAADAATVAAEEARDAADAATAAIEELATQVATLMAALKAQITTLANTVAKIAKKIKA